MILAVFKLSLNSHSNFNIPLKISDKHLIMAQIKIFLMIEEKGKYYFNQIEVLICREDVNKVLNKYYWLSSFCH
jgi:hypothetical protein